MAHKKWIVEVAVLSKCMGNASESGFDKTPIIATKSDFLTFSSKKKFLLQNNGGGGAFFQLLLFNSSLFDCTAQLYSLF